VFVGWYYSIGTRVGYRFTLDTSARHRLEVGFALGGGQGTFRISERGEDRGFRFGDEKGSACLTPSPIFQDRYHRAGSLSLGASLRANLLIALGSEVAEWFAPTLMFDCGWST
jgi:hypothetical protein